MYLAGRSGCKGAGRMARLLLCLASALALWGAVSGAGPPVQHGYAASFQGQTTIAGIRRGVIDWAAPGWRDVSNNVTWATWVRYSRHTDNGGAVPFRLVTKGNNHVFDLGSMGSGCACCAARARLLTLGLLGDRSNGKPSSWTGRDVRI